MADKIYWLGELVGKRRVGGIKVDGKLYEIGESFPADLLDRKAMAGFKKAGCIGSVPFPVSDSEPQGECAGCKELGDRIKEMNEGGEKTFAILKGQVKEKDNRIGELEISAKTDGDTIAGLQLELEAAGDVSALKIQVEELEPECKRLGDDNEEKAALIETQAKQIKKLKKELKK